MKRVLVNTCLDYLRSTYLKNSMKMHFNDKLLETVVSTTHNEGLEKLEFKRLVEMIQTLPVMTRTVFNLFIFEGYSHHQIGELLEISEGTSSWHVHHARSILQKKIKTINSESRLYENKRI
jgi:RNA polymerase sigma-70 factor (ECF subfamily)